MSFLSNLKLSKEDELIEMEMENSEPIEEVSVAESVQDDVDNSSDAEEFQETMVAAEEDVVEMEKQEEVLEGLQEQDSIIEEKLEQPEEVTPEDVVVAQEAFAFALGRLCSSNEDYKNFKQSVRVSYESNNNEPAAVLRSLHTEGFKEFIERIIASINALLLRVINWVKKLMVKIVILFDQSEKTLKKMEEVISKNSGQAVNKTEWERVAKNKLSAAMFVAKEAKKSSSLENALELAKNLKELGQGASIIKYVVNLAPLTTPEEVRDALEKLGLIKSSEKQSISARGGFLGYISFAGGTAMGVNVTIKVDEPTFTYTIIPVQTNKDPIPGGIDELNSAKTFNDLRKVITILRKHTNGIKTVSKDIETNANNIKNMYKNLKENSNFDPKAVNLTVKISKLILSHATLGALKTYVSVVRGGVAVVAAAMKPIENS